MGQCLLITLIILPHLSGGLGAPSGTPIQGIGVPTVDNKGAFCDKDIQRKYCDAWYGGDYHSACQFCGVGGQCPSGQIEARGIPPDFRNEILSRHNHYRLDASRASSTVPNKQRACLPPLEWDTELAETAQVWADQCAMIVYKDGVYPKIFHEKSFQRSTSRAALAGLSLALVGRGTLIWFYSIPGGRRRRSF